ncbi:MAG: protein translocase subunit SecD, partial [Gammaproteobacteria bacterium]|nr:protein translocase subunit SecD [Gammaproteobacteria bacterium]
MLIFIAVVGLIYAIPNLYTEHPVVQISAQNIDDKDALKDKVETILKDSKLEYNALIVEDQGVEIGFSSTDAQLQARDVIKNSLGNQYTVALNLASTTPHWMEVIHADPMKQGLDLRGGVHFLLEVDVESVISRRYEGIMKNISQELREIGLRYSGIRYVPEKGIDLRFRDPESMEKALAELKQKIPEVVFTKNKVKNSVLGSISPAELNTIRQNTIEQTMSILRNRVNELGVGEAVVQQQGATRVAVDLPGIQDSARAKQILGGTATLQFYLVDQENDPQIAKQTGVVPVSDKLYTMDGHPLLLKRQVVLSGDSITSAVSSFDQQTATPAVQIQLGGGGESLFTKVTRENIGKRMAIVYVETINNIQTINGVETLVTHREEKVISAPVIQNALGSNFQITGLTDSKEASDLALLLRAGALPAAIYPIEERTVGPTLGKENIRRGIVSLEVGMGLILVLMLVYYRFFGLIANFALLLNLVLLGAL